VPVVTDAVVPAHLQESWFGLIRGAYALGNRGAQYAARQEFERTLYEIAQTKDVLSGGQHTAALARALRALDEAADFLPGQGNVSAAPRADIILAGHQTPIASQLPTTLPASALMEAYHRYAEAQFGEAVGGVRAGSMALHALGKLYDRLATEDADNCRDAGDRAITLQRAALRAHGGNYLAANELGVLLARGGDHRRARQQFVRSLQLTRTREAWRWSTPSWPRRKAGPLRRCPSQAASRKPRVGRAWNGFRPSSSPAPNPVDWPARIPPRRNMVYQNRARRRQSRANSPPPADSARR
jgi:hypothetical protein